MPEIFAPQPEKQKNAPTNSTGKTIVKNQTEGKQATHAIHTPNVSHHSHPFAAYCDHPDGVWFQNMDPDEHLLLFLRKHPITNFPWLFFSFTLLLVPILIAVLFTGSGDIFSISFSYIPQRFITVLFFFYYLIVMGYMVVGFITWFYNVSIVTKKHVVDIDFSDVVYRNVATTTIDRVQDAELIQTGVIRSFFNYGDVYVRTEGIHKNFDFLAVPKPAQVVNVLQELLESEPDNA